ncbi:BnaUnng01770D [Brassica napus]|uniref:(rape) hypothetical protein n=1 Tax=Brassica napus TaxID=3708 RepID=A0A078JMM4_BRANA|nr:unnamed protein product [Brassica napus]CDY67006.1 BnaUnng01770D [Brassica napus]
MAAAPVKYDPNWTTTTTSSKYSNNVAYIVTRAQLEVKKHGSKSVLHLRFRFTGVSDHYVVQKDWVHGPGTSKRSGIFSSMSLPVTARSPALNGLSLRNFWVRNRAITLPLTSGSVHHNIKVFKDTKL